MVLCRREEVLKDPILNRELDFGEPPSAESEDETVDIAIILVNLGDNFGEGRDCFADGDEVVSMGASEVEVVD